MITVWPASAITFKAWRLPFGFGCIIKMQASLNKPAVTSHLGLQIIQYQFSVTNPDTKFHISVKTENRIKAQRQTDSYEMNTITVRNSVTI